MVKIIPLSRELLSESISLLKTIFPYKPDQRLLKHSLTDSLKTGAYGQVYWVAVDDTNSVIGITGLYNDKKDKKVRWIGWFGVHPDHRKLGIGSELLQYAIDMALQKGTTSLRLYTSSDPKEQAAHQLYKKFGFQQIGINKKADEIYFCKSIK